MDKKTSKQAKYLEFLSIYPDKQLYEMRFVINKIEQVHICKKIKG
jgi:hypothetical protein